MAVFHKLQTGLDVNVKFTGYFACPECVLECSFFWESQALLLMFAMLVFSVKDFEYTSECIIFDLLNIPLYHGWLTDPESPETVTAIGSCSYNQLVEKIISQKNSKKEELITEGKL